ncbi:hypothetical protein [uncultured Mailhella sp.]|uniref:hypothetical protein n=1 Tax=uncultured Mailhella sp. TaxID=1981031 RepID=UPI0025FF2BA4|nr:hypothetical protein [uncultured Mailhella sp.]
MLKKLLIVVTLVLCCLYVYQKQQKEIPMSPSASREVNDAPLRNLEGKLPSVIFEKEIQPVIERNRRVGLTSEELDELFDKLETIGRALGDQATEAVNQAGHAIAPDLFPRKTLMERSADAAQSLAHAAKEGAIASLPVLKEVAADILRALASALSFLLDKAADLLKQA